MPYSINQRRLGLNIRHYRHTRQLTQCRLAEMAGCSVDTLSRLEHGTQAPSVQLLFRLARALNCHVHELLEDV